MIQTLFDFPLPNNGDRYDLSKEELLELLQKAYENGKQRDPYFNTYFWSNTICPCCKSGNVYTTTTLMYGSGNITTYHCSNCGHSWEM
jgi:hypothetical protein